MSTPAWARVAVIVVLAGFIALGALWIERPGLQYDETLFVLASHPRDDAPIAYMMHFHGHPVALMIISYLGALKGWLYVPILRLWPGSVAAVRLPMLLVGAAGLGFLYLLARRAFGWRTALVALALAATDPIYLFTTRLDWGPVAIQRLCLLAGCYGVLCWWQQKRLRYLGLGCFAWGVGVFDKATFLWLLTALALSTVLVFGRQVWVSLRPKVMATALAGLLLGSAAFVYYCWKWPGESFRRESESPAKYAGKLRGLQQMLEGTVLVGWFSRDMDERPLEPSGALARVVYAIAPHEPQAETLLLPALLLALLLLPALRFAPWGRGMVLLLLFCLFGFVQMLLVADAGAIHHQALLLPFPQLFVAAGLMGWFDSVGRWLRAERFRTAAGAAMCLLVVVLVGANLRGVAHHYFRILAYGGGPGWTEAIYALEDSLEAGRPEKVVLLDWGLAMQLRVLTADRLPVVEAALPQGPKYDSQYLEAYLTNPKVLFVRHAPGEPVAFPQIAAAFDEFTVARGYRVDVQETVKDLRGRPIFEILAARPGPGTTIPPVPRR
jgi:4-amino-4-deoxy-L-arabinose transferase-like glycosyltransferase